MGEIAPPRRKKKCSQICKLRRCWTGCRKKRRGSPCFKGCRRKYPLKKCPNKACKLRRCRYLCARSGCRKRCKRRFGRKSPKRKPKPKPTPKPVPNFYITRLQWKQSLPYHSLLEILRSIVVFKCGSQKLQGRVQIQALAVSQERSISSRRLKENPELRALPYFLMVLMKFMNFLNLITNEESTRTRT